MSWWQALFMGLLQGATELFPVSSLGHAVLVPSLLHWAFKQSDPSFVPFLTLLHLGTATALLVLYWRQWIQIIRAFFTAAVRGRIATDNERLAMLLMVGTLPAAILIGLAFAGVGMAATTYMRSWQDLDLVQLAVLPMFLFSATFYPLSTYPAGLRFVVQLTPLYHAVALTRELALGMPGWTTLGHVAYLVALGIAGTLVAARRLERTLLT